MAIIFFLTSIRLDLDCSSSLLKNLEIESFRILAGRSVVVGAARVELDVIF